MKTMLNKKASSFVLLSATSLFAFSSLAIDNSNSPTATGTVARNSATLINSQRINLYSPAKLEQILAPIALYPDSLLTHILIASTYPIEIIDAQRWLKNHQNLSVQERAHKAETIDWDASVKALLPFEEILTKLSEDLSWMRNLGDAFLQQETEVLASIQSLRAKADRAGNLTSVNNIEVIREAKTIIIKPTTPEIIYVPYYDTRVIYGRWHWRDHPPLYWQQPVHYSYYDGPFAWHNPVHLTVGIFFGNFHWHNRHVIVHHHKSRYYKKHTKHRVAVSHQGKRWQHNPHHRKGVVYRNKHINKKYQHTKIHNAYKQKHAFDLASSKHKKLHKKVVVNKAIKLNKQHNKKHSVFKKKLNADKKVIKHNVYKHNKLHNRRVAKKDIKLSSAKPIKHKHYKTKTKKKPHIKAVKTKRYNKIRTQNKNSKKYRTKSSSYKRQQPKTTHKRDH